jgi:hypothetical protein
MHDYLRKKKRDRFMSHQVQFMHQRVKNLGNSCPSYRVKCTSGEALHGAEFSSRTMACVSHEKIRTSAFQQ